MVSPASNFIGFLGQLGGGDNYLTRLQRGMEAPYRVPTYDQDLRRQELEMRREERAQDIAMAKRIREDEIARQKREIEMQKRRGQALGNIAANIAGMPDENFQEFFRSGGVPSMLGQLSALRPTTEELVQVYSPEAGAVVRVPASQAVGRPVEAPPPSQRRIVEQGGVQYFADTGEPVIKSPLPGYSKEGKRPEKIEVFEYGESLRRDNPLAYERFVGASSKAGNNFKEGELKSANFANRMVGANDLLEEVSSIEGFSPIETLASFAGGLGSGARRLASSPDLQRYQNAAQDWIRAKLRKESGAVIGDQEMKSEYETYFPVFGDSQAVIAQKKILRDRATEGMVKQSGGAYNKLYLEEIKQDRPSEGGITREQAIEELKRRGLL